LGIASFRLLESFSIVVVAFLWIPIVVTFAANQIGLARVIRRAKWKTLRSIQATIDSLQVEEHLSEKGMREAIVWLCLIPLTLGCRPTARPKKVAGDLRLCRVGR
jgi:hypothetical protein